MPVTTRSGVPKRNVTSAVEGLSVADVRRCLDSVRRGWADRDAEAFSLLGQVDGRFSFTVQEFCFRFVLGHHRKRHAKSTTKGQSDP